MFYGEFRHQMDDKGRFRIPTDFRDLLGENAKMVVGFEKCIRIYRAEDYEKYVKQRFDDADLLNTKLADLKRVFASRTQTVEPDKQGRIGLKDQLAKLVGITKNIVSIGAMDHVEIWDEAEYDKYMSELDMEALLRPFNE